ncbi:MAG: hypothetical protein IJ407_04660 [Clostridia bacterium]|nr:hypothetical protein [Clostridia bacterium]
MQKKQKILIGIGAALLIVAVIVAGLLWNGFSAKPEEGSKAIVFEVVQKDGSSEEHEISTDAEYLADALVEEGLIEYAEDGFYTTIDGVTADWNVDQGWWCISQDGVSLSVGMNQQPIADGEHYEATYTIGY